MDRFNNYIIDGFNVGFKLSNAQRLLQNGDTDRAIPIILQHIDSAMPQGVKRIIVIFDGQGTSHQNHSIPKRIQVKFSKKPQTADDIIRKFIRSAKTPKEWTVVSSDNEILFTARDHGAETIGSDDFIRQNNDPGATKRSFNEHLEKYEPGNVDVDYWMNLFGSADTDDD
ncbi:MAG: hypothetical protein GF313_04700 [Caldithrix sp.]|nr:hypothetical protein [Caldithrix sp.]